MSLPVYLARTAAEFGPALPRSCAYMACHFSPYGTGLSNLPDTLPEGSLLLVNDRIPLRRHESRLVARQLKQAVEQHKCCGVLLDFQRPAVSEAADMVQALTSALPCPVGVSRLYAGDGDYPVFLPPPPPDTAPENYLKPWQHRKIWLDASLTRLQITVTAEGARCACPDTLPPARHESRELFCHYALSVQKDRAIFTLWRTKEDLTALLAHCEGLGVTLAAGLYQELQPE